MAEPKQPADKNNNPFMEFTSSLKKMFSGMEQREKVTNDKLDKLVKQMTLYYKLLETAYNKDKLASKSGRDGNLTDDKGFLKLLDIMTNVDDGFKKVIDKYTLGQRLQGEEKRQLAKFVQGMRDAMMESNEQIGVPIKDILKSFKKLISEDKINNDFRLDLFSFLRDYSEEDLAISMDLKKLLDESIKSGKVNTDKTINILTELDKNIEYYSTTEKDIAPATFAPYKRIDTELRDANVSLDEVVKLLTDNQRSNTKLEELVEEGGLGSKNSEGAMDVLAKELKSLVADLAGFGVEMGVKTTALNMAENPLTRGASPAVFSTSGLAGKAVGAGIKSFNPETDIPKLMATGEMLASLAPYLGGAAVLGASALAYNAGVSKLKETHSGLPASGKVTSTFNDSRDYGKHEAVDIVGAYGSPVKSSLGGGKVTKVASDKLSGNYVIVKNPQGTTESFSHLSEQQVKVGEVVNAGGTIGLSGTTGRTEGVGAGQAVVHYKVKDSTGKAIDPQKAVMDYSKKQDLQQTKFSRDKNPKMPTETVGETNSNPQQKKEIDNFKKRVLANSLFKNTYSSISFGYNESIAMPIVTWKDKVSGSEYSATPANFSYKVSDVVGEASPSNTKLKPAGGSSVSPEIPNMPSPKSTRESHENLSSNVQPISIPQPKEKSERKLKSDNDLLNHYIDYGDIG